MSFPPRPYASNLPRAGPSGTQNPYQSTPYNAQTTYHAPQQPPPQHQQQQNPGGFGVQSAATTQQQREAQRLERERHERAERERRENEERDILERLSDDQREEINEAFSLFDLDKDSHIDYHELKVALKAMGFDLPKPELLNILQTYGNQIQPSPQYQQQQASGAVKAPMPEQTTFTGPSRLVLNHATFVSLAAQRVLARDPREECIRAFELFDADNKGRIDFQDLRRIGRELGEGLQEEELQSMVYEFDVRDEGGVGLEEFIGICLGG